MAGAIVDSSRRRIGDEMTCGPLGFGCWRFVHDDLAAAVDLLEHAVSAGLDLVDTADIYGDHVGGAEELLGEVLAADKSLRERIVLATKGGIRPDVPYDSSAAALTAACEASLRRLGVDHVDLYQVHRPDLFAHPGEVAHALARLLADGKVRTVGVSNYSVDQYRALAHHLGPGKLVTSQPEFSAAELAAMRDGTLDWCMRDGLTPLAWSPLAGGRLATGEGVRPELVAVLDGLATREGTDRAAVALAFVLAHPSRPVALIGTQRPERVDAALGALSVQLDRADCYRIVEASEGEPLP